MVSAAPVLLSSAAAGWSSSVCGAAGRVKSRRIPGSPQFRAVTRALEGIFHRFPSRLTCAPTHHIAVAMNTISTSSALRSHSAPLRYTTQQIRHASLIRRPKRPYTFTQLVTLSDGSTFTHRTTSPQAVYRTTKDTKNNPLWNPSSQKLLNVEEDEAGRLRRFRARFGRGFDAEAKEVSPEEGEVSHDL